MFASSCFSQSSVASVLNRARPCWLATVVLWTSRGLIGDVTAPSHENPFIRKRLLMLVSICLLVVSNHQSLWLGDAWDWLQRWERHCHMKIKQRAQRTPTKLCLYGLGGLAGFRVACLSPGEDYGSLVQGAGSALKHTSWKHQALFGQRKDAVTQNVNERKCTFLNYPQCLDKLLKSKAKVILNGAILWEKHIWFI